MKLTPVRFANVIKLQNPAKPDVERLLSHSRHYEGNVFWMPEYPKEPYGHVVILTGEDASIGQSLMAGMLMYENELMAKNHGRQKGLHLRLVRYCYNLTHANTQAKLSSWYHSTSGTEILEMHAQLVNWMMRFRTRHENATEARQAWFKDVSHVISDFKGATTVQAPLNPKDVFIVKSSPTRH